ncbi:hypothetical protein BJY00DRAFT_310312 [Aspergillus carlsbadensis]|nr:hypothetical protein BJY00DRAFT_310312 [Aspergillus carlsbadensis]
MTDPFSVSAGVVGVVSLGLTLGQGFARYYGPWRDFDDEIRRFTTKVDGLLNTLRLLDGFVSPQTNLQFPSDQYRLLVLDNLASCREACERLEKMLEECKSNSPSISGSSATRKRDWLLKRMAYPFKKDTLVTLSGLVSGLQDNLSLALQLLQSALMDQQQRQIQALISRTSLIDITTTKILTVVDQQVVPTTSQAVVQCQTQSTKPTTLTMPEPSLLRDLCDQQQLMNIWLRRKRRMPASQIEQILKYCTCRRKPRFLASTGGYHKLWSFSGLSFSTYSLHEESCLLYVDGQQAVGLAGSYTFCNRFLGLSLQVMMTLTRGAGSFAFSPVIRLQAVVASDSPAFDLIKDLGWRYHSVAGTGGLGEWVKMALLRMFQEGRAAPTDRLEDGSTILHALSSSVLWFYFEQDSNSWSELEPLMKALIDAGVPSRECTVSGRTAADALIHHSPFGEAQGQSGPFVDFLGCFELLLNSGGYFSSITTYRSYERWNLRTSMAIARLLLTRNPHGFELHEVEIAILSRSAEALGCCLMSQGGLGSSDSLMTAMGYFHILYLSLGWPEGLRILLESPLEHTGSELEGCSYFTSPVDGCFKLACKYGENECASILLEYLESIDLDCLREAARLKDIPILTRTISALAKSRHKLQQLAVEHLAHDVLRSLSLPSSALLDTKAFDEKASVYSYAENDITIFERLYAAGFTDLNQCDGNSIRPLMDLSNYSNYHVPYQLIICAIWLVYRGASLYQLSEDRCPSFLSLVDAFGENLCSWYKDNRETGQDLRSLMMEQQPDVVEFLCLIITEDSRDSRSCACSNGGCYSSYLQILHGFFRYVDSCWAYLSPSTTAFAAMIDALQDVAPGRVSEDQRRDIALQTIRYLTFDPLDITHTCHKDREFLCTWGYEEIEQMDNDEIKEIHEEEAELIGQLEELVAEFTREYDELGYGLHDFIEQYLKPRLEELFPSGQYSEEDSEEEVDPDYQQRVRELGVNLE